MRKFSIRETGEIAVTDDYMKYLEELRSTTVTKAVISKVEKYIQIAFERLRWDLRQCFLLAGHEEQIKGMIMAGFTNDVYKHVCIYWEETLTSDILNEDGVTNLGEVSVGYAGYQFVVQAAFKVDDEFKEGVVAVYVWKERGEAESDVVVKTYANNDDTRRWLESIGEVINRYWKDAAMPDSDVEANLQEDFSFYEYPINEFRNEVVGEADQRISHTLIPLTETTVGFWEGQYNVRVYLELEKPKESLSFTIGKTTTSSIRAGVLIL